MTTRPYELLVRFAPDGSIAGVSARTITTIDGRDYEGDPKPLAGVSDPAFTAFAEQFAAAAVGERDALQVQLQQELDSHAAELRSLRTEVDTQLAELRAAHESALQALRQSHEAEISAANARIAELEAALPWNHRIIDASAFIARISPIELVELFGSADPVVQQIAAMLKAYRANDWPVVFESNEMQQAIAYLQQIGLISAERAVELTRDSTRDEAYQDGE